MTRQQLNGGENGRIADDRRSDRCCQRCKEWKDGEDGGHAGANANGALRLSRVIQIEEELPDWKSMPS